MSNNTNRTMLFIFMTLFVSGCETMTAGQGVVQGAAGTAVDRVSFSVKETFGGDQASVVARFASGERYTGKFIIAKSQSHSSTDFWDTSNADTNDLFTTSSSTTYHSKATGVLFGPSGKTMECRMTLASPSIGFSGGAVGKCKLSTGQIIPMQLSEA